MIGNISFIAGLISTLRTGLGGLDGGENHEGKRREKEKVLFRKGKGVVNHHRPLSVRRNCLSLVK
jgi:hypothetical protein